MAMNNLSGCSRAGAGPPSRSTTGGAVLGVAGQWPTLPANWSATCGSALCGSVSPVRRPYQVTSLKASALAGDFSAQRDDVGAGNERNRGAQNDPTLGASQNSAAEEDVEGRRMRLEAILLLAKTPLSTRKLAQLAHLADGTEARTLVRHLNRCYDQAGRAMRIEHVAGGYRLLTRPAFSPWLARLGHLPSAVRLSSPMMETLAVVAYRQNVSRADIEAVRGVACGELLRQLMERDLVRIAGRGEELGRPYLYGTTKRFLQLFGLSSIEALPPIRWQSFQSKPDARETDEPTDSNPNDLTTSMKESVVSTAFVSVPNSTDSTLYTEIDPQLATGVVSPLLVPVRSEDDDDDDYDDDEEDDDLEEDDDFDDDWDDEDEEDDDDVEDDDEADEWEEVDDADVDDDEEDEDADELDDEEDDDDDWDDEDDLDDDLDDDEDDDDDEDEWD